MLKSFQTVFTKEFSAYFCTGTAYVVMAVYLVLSFAAAFYFGGFFQLNNASLISFFQFQPQILTLLIPAVTMRSWADERRSGTIEYLLTQPLGYTTAVFAKFSAAWLFGIIMLVLTVPFWIYASYLTTLDNLNIVSSYLVCILIIGAFASLGCVISAFNTNPVIAYIISIFVFWSVSSINFDFLVNSTQKLSSEVFSRVVRSLNFVKHYQDFMNGQIGLDNIIYFVSIIMLALWLNVITLEYKKK